MLGERIKRILALFLAALTLSACIAGCKNVEPTEIRGIAHFFFTESGGSDFDARTAYQLDYADGYYTAVIKPAGVKEKKARTVIVDAEFVDRLEAVLTEYDVKSWNGFDEKDYDIMDGIGFSLDVVMADESEIDAVGYMEWPEGFGYVSSAFDELFLGAYKK